MSATQATVTSTQVAVRYRQNVGSLSIDMSADCQTTTLSRHIGRVLVEISADISVDMSVNMSANTSRSIYRPSVGRYVDRDIGRRVHKIHMVRQPNNITSLPFFFLRKQAYENKLLTNMNVF